MVELNITLVIQMVNFVVALFVLNILLVRPVRAIMRKRKEMTEAMVKDAGKFAAESALRLGRYEAELESVRARASGQRETARAQAVESGRVILDNAQEEAAVFLQRSRKEAEQEVEAARRVLFKHAGVLSDKVVTRILG